MNTTPKSLPADERRAVIIESVITLAATQNPSKITTAAIAQQMELTQGALFRHFANKEAVWTAVMEWVTEQLLKKIDVASKDIPSALPALEAMFMAHVEFVSTYPGAPRILFGELQQAELTPAKSQVQILIHNYRTRLSALIEKGKTSGELLPTLDSSATALLFIGTIQGLIMQSLLSGDPDHVRKNASAVFTIFKRGIENT
ncbi:MAG TPA: TetR/AcrR family transcriptional regulator [Alcaligenaceae bacterium]|nr:TetR/AcrR family transcriptional regulator [Alcaligenaceae bacterium]